MEDVTRIVSIRGRRHQHAAAIVATPSMLTARAALSSTIVLLAMVVVPISVRTLAPGLQLAVVIAGTL